MLWKTLDIKAISGPNRTETTPSVAAVSGENNKAPSSSKRHCYTINTIIVLFLKYTVSGEDTRYDMALGIESRLEGTVELWSLDPGDVIEKDYGPVLLVDEAYNHGLQIEGLCTNCAKNMT